MAEITARDQRRLIPITSSSSIQQLIHHNDGGGGQNFFFISSSSTHGKKWKNSLLGCCCCNDYWIIYWPEPGAHKSTRKHTREREQVWNFPPPSVLWNEERFFSSNSSACLLFFYNEKRWIITVWKSGRKSSVSLRFPFSTLVSMEISCCSLRCNLQKEV